jgi:HEAT repeat protein
MDADHVILAQENLLPLLHHADAVVRGDAANLVGLIGNSASLPRLKELMEDENGNVRLIAQEAIQELESDSAQ